MTTSNILNKIKKAVNEYSGIKEEQVLASFTYKGHEVILHISDVKWDVDGLTIILSEK